ncbi:MAG: hypothetical protein ACR2HH_04675 [Chthoniobacterales bacterium]
MLFRVLTLALFLAVADARAVILFETGDPSTNTTAPTGNLAGSGWQFEGTFGPFLGTPIAPNFFITAKHIGAADSVFYYNGNVYPVARQFNDAFSDFSIWQITGTFPTFAPLYTSGGETGQQLVVFGRGTQRGSEIILGGTLRGWNWGPGDRVERWGENVVNAIVQDGPANAYLYATFDQDGVPNESHLSSGDSGGAIFLQEGGVWKLAGINYAVDDLYMSAVGGPFTAAVFDTRGFYFQDSSNPPHYTVITGTKPQPTGFYSTQISAKLGWLYSVIDPAGDADGNGISNRLDYARALNAAATAGPGAVAATKATNALTFTYRKLTTPNNLQYAVEQSNDLVHWMPAAPNESIVRSGDDVQTVKASVPLSNTPTFLRIEITGP